MAGKDKQISFERLSRVFHLGSGLYKVPKKILPALRNRDNADHKVFYSVIFRNKEDIYNTMMHPVSSMRSAAWSERLEQQRHSGRLVPGERIRLAIRRPMHLVSSSNRKTDKSPDSWDGPFVEFMITKYKTTDAATVTELKVKGEDIPLTTENIEKSLALAALTADQIVSGTKVDFEANYRLVFGNERGQKLRHLMSAGHVRRKPKQGNPAP